MKPQWSTRTQQQCSALIKLQAWFHVSVKVLLFSFKTVSILGSVSSAIKKDLIYQSITFGQLQDYCTALMQFQTTGLTHSQPGLPRMSQEKKKLLTIWKTTNPKLRREIILWRILMFRSVIVLFTKCSKLNARETPSMHDSTTLTKKVVLSQYLSLSRRLHKLLGHLVKI